MFTFVYIELKRCPSIKQWLLRADNFLDEAVVRMQSIWTRSALKKYLDDPHLRSARLDGILNVPNLAKGWTGTLIQLLARGPVGFNKVGGMQPIDKTVRILDTKQHKKFIWPEDKEPEAITISRWPNGKHYYLTSSLNRELSQKYKLLASAKRRARKYVSKEQIIVKPDEFAYKREGD